MNAISNQLPVFFILMAASATHEFVLESSSSKENDDRLVGSRRGK